MTRSIRTRHTFRPRLHALEDRQLLSAGALDTATFNPPNGFVVTPFTQTSKGKTTTSGQAWAVQVQSDGKIVAVGGAFGDFALARYNADGSLDTTFGSAGKVLTAFNNSQGASGSDLVIQPDGKILVAGSSDQGTLRHPNSDFAVARYNSNGTLDTTFGPGHNGMLTTDFGGGEHAVSIILQPDMSSFKILVGGWTGDPNYSWPTSASKFALARYTANGTLDSTFGSGGKVITDITPDANNGGTDSLADLGLENVNGTTKIVAAGETNTSGDSTGGHAALVRYNLDGTLDTTFGNGPIPGVVITSDNPGFELGISTGRLAIQSDQKIIVSGGLVLPTDTRNSMAAARFNLDGSFDTTFNPSGPWPGIATSGYGIAYAVVIQPGDGKIVLAGVVGDGTGNASAEDTKLARLNPDGTLDTTFGGGTGYVVQPLSAHGDEARGVALQADGKIVTAGPIQDQNGSWNIGFAVARFQNGAATTTTLASSANPSASGQSVTFTATVSTTGTASPTGTVQFLDGSTLLGTGTLSPASATTATATFTTSALAVGTHSITAVYGGDSNDMGSTSSALSQVVNTTTSTALVTRAALPAAPMPATAPSFSPGSLLAPLVLDDPSFLTSLVSGKRRRSS